MTSEVLPRGRGSAGSIPSRTATTAARVREVVYGRRPATPDEARDILGLNR